ncbi:MAG: response regulator [Bacteroidota bacterium]
MTVNKKMNILVADDKVMNQKVLSLMLKSLGHTCDLAFNGKEAVELYEDDKYDLIILDVMMPVMDGIEASLKIKDKAKNLPPMIALTADNYFHQSGNFCKSAFIDVIFKPLARENLNMKIQEYAGTRKTFEEEPDKDIVSDIKDQSLFKEEVLRNIYQQSEGDYGIVDEIVRGFIQDARQSYKDIIVAIEKEDPGELKGIIHSLKGLSGTIGANRIQFACISIEHAAREKNNEMMQAILILLEKVIDDSEIFLNDFRSNLTL